VIIKAKRLIFRQFSEFIQSSNDLLVQTYFFGHLWHASRAVFQDLWTGLSVTIESLHQVEYGRNEKLGDKTSKTSTFL